MTSRSCSTVVGWITVTNEILMNILFFGRHQNSGGVHLDQSISLPFAKDTLYDNATQLN